MINQLAILVLPQSQATALSLNTKVAMAQIPNDTNPSLLAQLDNDSVIVTGTKHNNSILQEYEREFGNNIPFSTVARKKGKNSHN